LVITHFSARYTNQYNLLKETREDFFPTWIATELRPIFTDPTHERGIIQARAYTKRINTKKKNKKKKRKKRKKKRFRKRKKVNKNSSKSDGNSRRKRRSSEDSNNSGKSDSESKERKPKPITPRTSFDDFDRF